MSMRQLCLLVFLMIFAGSALSQTKHPFGVDDLMKMQRIGDPMISPDGTWVLFSAVEVNLQENRKTRHLWIIPLAGGEARQLTYDRGGEAEGSWSPDGRKILFLSGRDGSAQLWIADFARAGGKLSSEPRKITNISTGADGPIWSPNGRDIIFTSRVYPDCDNDACNAARYQARAASKTKALHFDHLGFRDARGYTDFKRSHLFVVPQSGDVARDLTPGDHDVPSAALDGAGLYAVSPDGREIAFAANLDEERVISNRTGIYVVPIAGGQPKEVSTSPGVNSSPTYSPDGRYLAWRTQKRAGDDDDRFTLQVRDRTSGQLRTLSENFDGWVETIAWSAESSAIYFTSDDKGEKPVYRLDVKATSAVTREVTRGSNYQVAVSRDGKSLVFVRRSVMAPGEIYKIALPSKQPIKLTHLNDAVLAQVLMQPLETFWFLGAGGDNVEGFLLKPPGLDPSRQYPVKFLIHGGPVAAWGDDWFYGWQNPEIYAANGYVIVIINFHGSLGYGQTFVDAINGNWGGTPYDDLMKGLDFVEDHYAFIDKTRECALGASYGGYMVNWILGHTNRFKCLVSKDGAFNLESTYGTFPALWFPEWEFGGTPWTNRDSFRKWSPHQYADRFATPTLVVHGQFDYLLDVAEGLQLFTTLQRLNIPSEMLYFPDDGHFLQKPQNDALLYNTVNKWVDRWTRSENPK